MTESRALDTWALSVRFCNLPALAQSSLWIFVFLPRHRIHGVARFADGHNDAEFVACCGEVVVGLVTQ